MGKVFTLSRVCVTVLLPYLFEYNFLCVHSKEELKLFQAIPKTGSMSLDTWQRQESAALQLPSA